MRGGIALLSVSCISACLCAHAASYTLSSSQRSFTHSVFWSQSGGEANSYSIVVPKGYSATVRIERSSSDYAGMNEDKSKNRCSIVLNGASQSWNRYSYESKVAANATLSISCFTSPYFYREQYWIGSGSYQRITYRDIYYTSYYCRYYYKISVSFEKAGAAGVNYDVTFAASGGRRDVFTLSWYASYHVDHCIFYGSANEWLSNGLQTSPSNETTTEQLIAEPNKSSSPRTGKVEFCFSNGTSKMVTVYQGAGARASYRVAFNANGGKLPKGKKMAAQTLTYGKAAKLRKNVFTRKGYVFAGWATSKANAKKGLIAYKNAQSVNNLRADGGTTTLYAVWAKKTYKVKFYANGGKGKMAVEKFTYGKAKKLMANKFTRKGYVFKGWATSKANARKGVVKYKNKKTVKNLVTTGKTVKLYAVWKKK